MLPHGKGDASFRAAYMRHEFMRQAVQGVKGYDLARPGGTHSPPTVCQVHWPKLDIACDRSPQNFLRTHPGIFQRRVHGRGVSYSSYVLVIAQCFTEHLRASVPSCSTPLSANLVIDDSVAGFIAE